MGDLDVGTVSGKVEIHDGSGPVLESFVSKLGDTSKAATGLGDSIKGGIEDPLGTASGLVDSFIDRLGPLGIGIAAIAGAAVAVGAATAVVVELGSKGSEVNDVTEAFDRFSGGVHLADANLSAMRAGVVGTINDFDLMKDANHLLAVGAVTNAEGFKTLTEAARVLSHDGFGPIPELLNTVSGAMETGRLRALARMGVTVDQVGAEHAYAASLGISIQELTAAQKLEATRGAVMTALKQTIKEAGDQELTFKERLEQAKTTMENANNALSVAVATSPVLATLLGTVGEALSKAFGENQASTIQTLVGWINQGAIALVGFAEDAIKVAEFVNNAFYGTREIFANIEGATVGLLKSMVDLVGGASRLASQIPGLGGVFKGLTDNTKDWSIWLGGVKDGLKKEGEQAIDTAGVHDAALEGMSKSVEGLRQKMIQASEATVDNTAKTKDMGTAHKAAAADVDTDYKALEAYNKAVAKVNEALSAQKVNTEVLSSSFKGWIDDMVKAKVTMEDIVLVTGLTKGQIDQITTATKDSGRAEADAAAAVAKSRQDDLDATQRVIDKQKDFMNGVVDVGVNGVKTFDSLADAVHAFEGGLDAATIKVRGLDGQIESLAQAQQRMDSGGSETYDFTTASGQAEFAKQNPMATMDPGVMARLASGKLTLQQAVQSGAVNLYGNWTTGGMPSFKEGGAGDFGDGTLAMLHGKEIITPYDSAVGGSNTQNNHIYVNGTAADVAEKIADVIMNKAKMGRQYGAR